MGILQNIGFGSILLGSNFIIKSLDTEVRNVVLVPSLHQGLLRTLWYNTTQNR